MWLTIVICIIVLLLFIKTKHYDSLSGALMFSLAVVALYLRSAETTPTNLVVPGILSVISFSLSALITLVAVIVIIRRKRKNNLGLGYAALLFILYLLFGYLQQLLFQYAFLETLLNLTGNTAITIVLSSFYYSLFHTKASSQIFFYGTFLVGMCWSAIYLFFGNLHWIALSHATLGLFFYVWFVKENKIKQVVKFMR